MPETTNSAPVLELRPTEKEVLAEVLKRTLAIEKAKRPTGPFEYRERDRYEDEKLNGPRYLTSEWFNNDEPLPEARRVRYLRSTHRLIRSGLMTGVRSEGGKLVNVHLTEKGRKVALELAGEGKKPARKRKTKT